MKTINSIILAIVTFLLTIFPWSASLEAKYQQLTYPGEMVITENIIEAIKRKDIEAIESMLSESKKSKELSDEILTLIDSLDGDIVEAGWYSGCSDSVKKDYMSVESYVCWVIRLKTDEHKYDLYVGWVRASTNSPETVGMDSLALYQDDANNVIAEVY